MVGGDPSTTGNDGISSISCIPLRCCANTACPTRPGRIGGRGPVYPSSTWQPLREPSTQAYGGAVPPSVCSAPLHSLFLLFTFSCLSPTGRNTSRELCRPIRHFVNFIPASTEVVVVPHTQEAPATFLNQSHLLTQVCSLNPTFGFQCTCKLRFAAKDISDSCIPGFEGPLKFTTSHVSLLH